MTTEHTGDTINLTPNWEGLARWNAVVFSEHGYEKFAYGPMAAFIEQVRFLAIDDPAALQRVIDDLERREQMSHARVRVSRA